MGRSEKCGAQGGAPRTWRIWRLRMAHARGRGRRAARRRPNARPRGGWGRLGAPGAPRSESADDAWGLRRGARPCWARWVSRSRWAQLPAVFFAFEPPASRRAPNRATSERLQPVGRSAPVRVGGPPHATSDLASRSAAPGFRFALYPAPRAEQDGLLHSTAGCGGASNVVFTRPNTDPRGRHVHGTDGRRRVGTRREQHGWPTTTDPSLRVLQRGPPRSTRSPRH